MYLYATVPSSAKKEGSQERAPKLLRLALEAPNPELRLIRIDDLVGVLGGLKKKKTLFRTVDPPPAHSRQP